MHNCPPPETALTEWLKSWPTVVGGNYGHLLLEQQGESGDAILGALRPYFESAHRDARDHFHAKIGISLHPDGNAAPVVRYPRSLPEKAKRGLFGEVLAGLVTEAYRNEFVGEHPWRVPIFLFREHDDVEKYLWALRFDPNRAREIYGRHGTDFVGIALGGDGEVIRVIAGEAKWRKNLIPSVVDVLLLGDKERNAEGVRVHNGKGIWFELNRDTVIPHGLRQLQHLLEQCDPDGHAATILSIDRAVLGESPPPERTDLVVIAGNGAKRRQESDYLIDYEKVPEEYEAGRDLQVVEIILKNGEELIDALYASLWNGD